MKVRNCPRAQLGCRRIRVTPQGGEIVAVGLGERHAGHDKWHAGAVNCPEIPPAGAGKEERRRRSVLAGAAGGIIEVWLRYIELPPAISLGLHQQ